MDPIDLWFRLSEVRPITEHAISAPAHIPSLSQQLDDEPAQPSLVWVKDDGCYLMSNGDPMQLADPDDPARGAQSAYAVGWGPGTRSLLGVTAVGRDDFEEHLPLHATHAGNTTLIERIRAYADVDGWLIITATTDTYEISFTSHPPTTKSPRRRTRRTPH